MGADVLIGVVASIFTTITGFGWIIERSGKRIDQIINHMEKVESILNEMRADMPLMYTLKEDHLRLANKVEKLETRLNDSYTGRSHDV
jgi:hypothetical protein